MKKSKLWWRSWTKTQQGVGTIKAGIARDQVHISRDDVRRVVLQHEPEDLARRV